ncbi:methyltransferase domain-containing protein [Coraliomargarita sp. SDUM461004]|uniref:Methyltransferase domain-containing protein n=1 Tax=Thalassobacterium sedimentorum TaxID=3041258 RepID=A0ABU1ANE8_9BACT|nr:methyltransferase domain-containing protein [Coraliomargarita sp. SDUM461004]MDQ8196317.1 methyltransferase domain-containing protein [Coraliomargarita sp. SDUM461004]
MDPYTNPDSQTDRTRQAMVTRLEERGQHAFFQKMIDDYVDTIPSDQPLRALDLGCGTGVVARRLANALHPDSEIHGADISDVLLTEGRRQDVAQRIHWDHIQPGALPYEERSFDVIVMHTLLSHVPNPLSLLQEAERVLAPTGQLIVFDADHAGTTYGQESYEAMRRVDHLLTSAVATHPDLCRQMPRYLKTAGLSLNSHRSVILSECGRGDYWLSSVRGFAGILPALNVLSEEEGQQWVDAMHASHDNGTFFASGAFFTFYASHS